MILGYLDPVTGSALLQVALGALAAIGLGWQYIRKGAQRVWTSLRGNDAGSTDGPNSELTEAETTAS